MLCWLSQPSFFLRFAELSLCGNIWSEIFFRDFFFLETMIFRLLMLDWEYSGFFRFFPSQFRDPRYFRVENISSLDARLRIFRVFIGLPVDYRVRCGSSYYSLRRFSFRLPMFWRSGIILPLCPFFFSSTSDDNPIVLCSSCRRNLPFFSVCQFFGIENPPVPLGFTLPS